MDATPILTAVAGGLVGIGGTVVKDLLGLRRLKDELARKDHEHRQSYYHDALNAADAFLADLRTDTNPDHLEYLEEQLRDKVNGLSVFGTTHAMTAARELLDACRARDGNTMEEAKTRLLHAARADVGPD